MPDPTPSVRLTESTRIEAFSDAVMAIVITILALELRVPRHEPGQLSATLAQMWASIGAFVISFLRVSVLWLNHHALFARIRRMDRRLLWLNLWVLLNCMMFPSPTAVLADALRGGHRADLRIATILYVLVAALQSAAWIPIFPYLRAHPELVEAGTDAAYFHAQRVRPWVGVSVDAVAVAVAIASPFMALVLWGLALIFLGATSEGVRTRSVLARRRAHRSEDERVA